MEQAAVSTPVSTRLTPSALVRALRPDEWVKNSFVFAGLLFGGEFGATGALKAGGAFIAFCAVASAGYLVNDIRDIELDRRHPSKRYRAIASGALPVATARVIGALLLAAGLGVALLVSPGVCGVVAAYGALTLSYSLVLKRLVIIDVMTIAGCFLLRVVAGTVAVGVEASPWLLVCTGMVSLFLGFIATSATVRDHSSCATTPIRKTDTTPSSAAAKRLAVKLSPLTANTPPRRYG
jgi:4-hydroxybenzoate polyprenyltransferase